MFIAWPGPRVLRLYPFRFRDRLTGKWIRARYVAQRHEIAARHVEWEITGQPEMRPDARYFTPHKDLVTSIDNRGSIIAIAGWVLRVRRRVVIAGVVT